MARYLSQAGAMQGADAKDLPPRFGFSIHQLGQTHPLVVEVAASRPTSFQKRNIAGDK